MTKASFSDLLVAVKRHWTSRDGLVILLEKTNPAKPGCRLCVPGMQPSTLVPELCILWKGDEAIYKGRLDSHELRCKLTDEGVCRALFTSTRLMQSVNVLCNNCFQLTDLLQFRQCLMGFIRFCLSVNHG